jgi:hypothetical protein
MFVKVKTDEILLVLYLCLFVVDQLQFLKKNHFLKSYKITTDSVRVT